MIHSMMWDQTTPIRAVLAFGSPPLAWTRLTELTDQVCGIAWGGVGGVYIAITGEEIVIFVI
jgi:hypothetical protein